MKERNNQDDVKGKAKPQKQRTAQKPKQKNYQKEEMDERPSRRRQEQPKKSVPKRKDENQFIKSLVRDLSGESIQKAIVLAEVLGEPVAKKRRKI
jgi:hypothetical protein